jgi:hypothetical protein
LRILFWAGCALVVIAIAWPFVRGLVAPAIVLAIVSLALWRFRDAPVLSGAWRRIANAIAAAWNAVRSVPFSRGYAHAFERAAHEQQERDTQGELRRIAEAENAQIPTAEGAVFLSQAREAMEERLERLLMIAKPTLAQHREREQIVRWLKDDRKRANALLDLLPTTGKQETRSRKQANGAAQPRAGLLASPFLFLGSMPASAGMWILGALVALSGGLYARGEKLKADARREHAARIAAAHDRDYWRARAGRWERAYADASSVLQANAARQAREAALSAQHLAAAEQRNRRLSQDLRRIRNETTGSHPGADPGASLRVLSDSLDAGAESGAGDPAAGPNPGL